MDWPRERRGGTAYTVIVWTEVICCTQSDTSGFLCAGEEGRQGGVDETMFLVVVVEGGVAQGGVSGVAEVETAVVHHRAVNKLMLSSQDRFSFWV